MNEKDEPEPSVVMIPVGDMWSFEDLRAKGVSLDDFFGVAARFNDEEFIYPCPFSINEDVSQLAMAKWLTERGRAGSDWCQQRSDEAEEKFETAWQAHLDESRRAALERLAADQLAASPEFLNEAQLLDDSLPSQLRSAGLKIWWARHHFDLLRDQVIAYEKSRPGRLKVREAQADGKPPTYVAQIGPIAQEVALIVGDLLGCLRVALDHIAWGLVPKPNREVVRVDNGRAFIEQLGIGFPFLFEDPDKGTSGTGVLKKKTVDQAWINDADAIDLLKFRQPYSGPETEHTHPREWLELLVQRDKHRVITPVAVGTTGGVIHGGSAISVATGGDFVLKDGDVFEQGPDGIPIVDPDCQVRLSIDIAFEEIAHFAAERTTSFFGGEVLGHVPRETTAEIVLARIINLLEDTFVEARKHKHLFANADVAGPVRIPSVHTRRGAGGNPPGFPL